MIPTFSLPHVHYAAYGHEALGTASHAPEQKPALNKSQLPQETKSLHSPELAVPIAESGTITLQEEHDTLTACSETAATTASTTATGSSTSYDMLATLAQNTLAATPKTKFNPTTCDLLASHVADSSSVLAGSVGAADITAVTISEEHSAPVTYATQGTAARRLAAHSMSAAGSGNFSGLFGLSDDFQIKAQQVKSANITLPGFFAIDASASQIYLDEQAASMLGLAYNNNGRDIKELLQLIRWIDVDLLMNFLRHPMGHSDEMYFELHVIKGSQKGNAYYFNIGALVRHPDGDLILASGFFSYLSTDTSRTLFHESGKDGSWDWDGITGVTNFSASYKEMLGYTPDDPDFPKTFAEWEEVLVHPDDRQSTADKQLKILQSPQYGDSFECCIRLRHKDGHYIWTLGRGMVLGRNKEGTALRLTGTNTDIEFVRYRNDVTISASWTDNLTGLQNRKYFDAHIENYLQKSNAPLCCLFADVSGLKMLNDCLGHDVGDELLKRTAKALHKALSIPCDIIRYGGDEFLLMLPRCTHLQLEMLQFNLKQVCEALNDDQCAVPLCLGSGIATLDESNGDINAMIALADTRAQDAKQAQRTHDYERITAFITKRLGHAVTYKDERSFQVAEVS